jgi:hypothetical protein
MKLGDIYTYRRIDLNSKQESQFSQRVTKIDDTSVEFNDGRFSWREELISFDAGYPASSACVVSL